ncbi:MAG: IS4 family transposase [Bacteroidia bacterium]
MTSKSTNANQIKTLKSINQKIKNIRFDKHARASGLKKRKAQKITGKTLLIAFMLMALQGNNSFSLWAEKICNITCKTVSKQAVWKKVSRCLTHFLSAILLEALGKQVSTDTTVQLCKSKLKRYKRVLLQDSTVIALPVILSKFFPGNVSRGKQKAQLKIQVIFDLLSNRFIHFEITPYTANDQSKSKDILDIAQQGDLVIRDLGYFSLPCFKEMSNQNFHYISRIKYDVKIFDIETGKEKNLLRILRKEKSFDQWVLIGAEQKVMMRLVILPLSKEQANQRRYKAKHDRDQRFNHDKKHYEMLGYSLLITTESKNVLTPLQVVKAYGCRWRIESIFKCGKSQFHLQKLFPSHVSISKQRAEAII